MVASGPLASSMTVVSPNARPGTADEAAGGGALDHLHRRRVAPRQDVAHEHVQVRGGAAAVRRCCQD
jgi:hypothetical protein